ncbi:hypothetical protein DdX_00679 [Ditylenchus destructor]|uniref:Uncharacterized protein n=1 Tax=Ditylenchus destructor TaxID=166010 RepID=A0AAD4NHG6_9BILA|nr:hypothetical protein DdX_00679 [Ditylenchus destructor]
MHPFVTIAKVSCTERGLMSPVFFVIGYGIATGNYRAGTKDFLVNISPLSAVHSAHAINYFPSLGREAKGQCKSGIDNNSTRPAGPIFVLDNANAQAAKSASTGNSPA